MLPKVGREPRERTQELIEAMKGRSADAKRRGVRARPRKQKRRNGLVRKMLKKKAMRFVTEEKMAASLRRGNIIEKGRGKVSGRRCRNVTKWRANELVDGDRGRREEGAGEARARSIGTQVD